MFVEYIKRKEPEEKIKIKQGKKEENINKCISFMYFTLLFYLFIYFEMETFLHLIRLEKKKKL